MSTKISALPPSAGLVLTDIFPVVDDPGGVPVTQKATLSQLQTLFSSGAGSFVLKAGDSMTGLLNITTAATSLQAVTSDAGAANTPLTFEIYHQTSATPLAGFGNRLQFYADTDGANNQIQARIDTQWTDPADATRTSQMVLGTRTLGAIDSVLILGGGQTQVKSGLVGIPGLVFQNDLDTGLYSIAGNSLGISAGGALTLAVNTAGINVTAGLAYQYNSVNVIRAQTALDNYYFGPSGNLTGTGNANIVVGNIGFTANTTGAENTGLGNIVLFSNTTGSQNVALGSSALFLNVSGSDNVGVGYTSLFNLLSGVRNVGLGTQALFDLTTGSSNVAIGYQTGLGLTTGSNNTILGSNVSGLAAGLSNNIIIADGAGNRRINVDSAGLVGINTIVQNSTLHVQGSLALAYVAKVATYTATASDYTIDCTSGTFDVDLPTAVGITGRIYVIKNSGVGTITIDPDGAELIDSLATATLVSGASITTQSTGTGWIII